MLDSPTVERLGAELFHCLRSGCTMVPITASCPNATVDDAYRISQQFLALRLAAGEQVVGKKIGVTSSAVQEMLGVYQPDFGFLTDAMCVRGGTVDCANLRPQLVSYPSKIIQARLEFDAMVELDMTQMAPLQLVRLSKLKRILIQILNEQ